MPYVRWSCRGRAIDALLQPHRLSGEVAYTRHPGYYLSTLLLQRFAQGQTQRLSSMLRDIAEGRDSQHWQAAMR